MGPPTHRELGDLSGRAPRQMSKPRTADGISPGQLRNVPSSMP